MKSVITLKVNIVKLKTVVHILNCKEVKQMKVSHLPINHLELLMEQKPKYNPLAHPQWVTLHKSKDCQKSHKCSFKFKSEEFLIIKLEKVTKTVPQQNHN